MLDSDQFSINPSLDIDLLAILDGRHIALGVGTEPAERQVDLVTLRCSAPAIALTMRSASTAWEQDEILVFAVCEPSDCEPGDLELVQPRKRPRNAASMIAGVERLNDRSSAHRRFLPTTAITEGRTRSDDTRLGAGLVAMPAPWLTR